MEKKTCTNCKNTKNITEYFVDVTNGLPVLGKCKRCILGEYDPSPLGSGVDGGEALRLFNDGMKYREIADMLGVPMNTVKTWIRRARRGE